VREEEEKEGGWLGSGEGGVDKRGMRCVMMGGNKEERERRERESRGGKGRSYCE